MKRPGIIVLGLVLLVVRPGPLAAQEADRPIPVGDRACLFLDDHFIAAQSGLKRTWHPGKPHARPAIEPAHPWEHWPCLWGSCFFDPQDKRFRMYYQSTLYPSGAPGVSFRDLVCYAESEDGRTWVRPKLGLVEFAGSRENNILFDYAGVACAFVDPLAKAPAERLKMCAYVLKGSKATGGQAGLCWFGSADGTRWSFLGRLEAPAHARPEESAYVDQFQVTWDPLRERYLGHWRAMSRHALAEAKDGRRRAIGLTHSRELLRGWAPAELVVKADDEDDRKAAGFGRDPKAPDWAELYTMPMWNYGNHYLGLVTLFCLVDGKDGNGGGDLQFCYSNDGARWHRQPGRQTAVAPSGAAGLFPCFAQFNPPLEVGDELWIYYSENNGVHGVSPFAKSDGKIRAAAWRRDGFVSLDAGDRATLTTKPLAFEGKRLLLNVKALKGGGVRVAILGADGKPRPGLGAEDCDPLRGDQVRGVVSWGGRSDLSALRGHAVRLRLELSRASVYGFRFSRD